MPRFKRLYTLRALVLFVVVCFFLYTTPSRWLSTARLGASYRKPRNEGLDYVNMFIGTKNGGKHFDIVCRVEFRTDHVFN
jgi:hypothetical protein